jgi:hypothetical protein
MMSSIETLILPSELFPTPDTIRSIVEGFDHKPAVFARFGSPQVNHYAQVGWVESVSAKPEGLFGVLMLPPEGVEKLSKGELEVKGQVSYYAARKTIESARLVEVRLIPK